MANVLIIDSDAIFIRIYTDVLVRAQHTVHSCTSFSEVYEALKRFVPDVAFVELSIGGGDGVTLGEVIKRRNASAQIVGIGTTAETRLMSNAARMGVTDYMQKPIEAEFMLATLGRLLDRHRLLSETNRLVDENLRQLAQQRVLRDGFTLLRTLDEGALYERILEVATPHTRCQGLALYVNRSLQLERVGYKGMLAEDALPEALPDMSMMLDSQPQPTVLPLDQPLRFGGSALPKVTTPEKGRGAMLVFANDGRVDGVLVGTARSGHPFDTTDMARMQLLAEVCSVAINNARRYASEQKKNAKNTGARILSMRFFVESLGKELHKARRYHRRFALLEVSIDGFAALDKDKRSHVAQLMTALLEKHSREADTVARAGDHEFLMLLPETDLGGARTVMSRIEEGIANEPEFAAQKVHPTVGGACFPNDGNDVDALLSVSRQRTEENRQSPYRLLGLEGLDFWQTAEKLLSYESPLRNELGIAISGGQELGSATASTYATFTPQESVAIARELILARLGRPEQKAHIFVGVPEITNELVRELGAALPASWKNQVEWLTLIGADDGRAQESTPGIRRVVIDAELSTRLGYVICVDANAAYALLGENLHAVPGEAFHTADYRLVLGLARKLQAEFKLEKGL